MNGSTQDLTSRARFELAVLSRAEPSRAEPSRAEPSRAEPSRAEPSRAEPSRAEPSRAEPSRAEPSRAEPSRAEPSRAEPSRAHDGASGRPSLFSDRIRRRTAGGFRAPGRRGLVGSAHALAAAALLALFGGLALPATVQAQETAPTLTSASVAARSGGSTTLWFSEDLDLTVGEALSAAARGAFSLTVNGVAQNIPGINGGFLLPAP